MANGDAGDMSTYNSVQRKITEWIYKLQTYGFVGAKTISIGRIEGRMKRYASDNGIALGSSHIYLGPKSLSHTFRQSKAEREDTIRSEDLVSFVKKKNKMDLYWDGEAFIYTDYKNKFIINPNYKIKINRKKVRKVSFITAGKVTDAKEFNLSKYKKV